MCGISKGKKPHLQMSSKGKQRVGPQGPVVKSVREHEFALAAHFLPSGCKMCTAVNESTVCQAPTWLSSTDITEV